MNRLDLHRRSRRSMGGFTIGLALAGIALVATAAGVAYNLFGNQLISMHRVTRNDDNLSRVRTAMRVLDSLISDSDADGTVEMPAWLAGAGPSDGGVLPATFPGNRSDAWGSLLGYCNWDHGTTNVSTGRIAGTTTAYEALPLVAVISPGPNKTFETTCADAYANITQGDDLIIRQTVTEASTGSTGGGDLWKEEGPSTISYGAATPNANRVGVGTATPGYTFTVNAPVQQQGISLQTGATPVARLRGQTASNDDGEMILYHSGAENARISSGAIPELHLGGWLRAQSVVNQAMFGWNVRHSGSAWQRVNADGGAAIRMHGTDSVFGAGSGGISFHVDPDGAAGSNISQMDSTDLKMGINANGVAIGPGFSNASAPLTIRQANNLATGGNAGLRIENSTGAAITQLITGSDNFTYLFNGTGSNFLSMTTGGNVGIGINSTGYKLDVNGDAMARGWLRSTGATGWYNDTYAGGWFMSDSSWIRSYSKPVYMTQGFDTSSGVTSGIGCNGGAGYPGFSVHVCGYAVLDQTWAPNFHNAASYLVSGACQSGACASDIRIKDHVRPFKLGLHELLGIDLVYYRYTGLGGMPKMDNDGIGVIAQQVEQTVPQLVKTKMVKMDPDDETDTAIKLVDYTTLPWLTMNAVKELNTKVEAQAALIREQASLIQEQQSSLQALKQEIENIRAASR